VQGSYSAYADPLARRAIAVSMVSEPVDESAPNHPVHPSRLQFNIRRRIRDPNQRNAIIAHYNSDFRGDNFHRGENPSIGKQLRHFPFTERGPARRGDNLSPQFGGNIDHRPSQPYFARSEFFPSKGVYYNQTPFERFHDRFEHKKQHHHVPYFHNKLKSDGLYQPYSSGIARFQQSSGASSGFISTASQQNRFLTPHNQAGASDDTLVLPIESQLFDDFFSPSKMRNLNVQSPSFPRYSDEEFLSETSYGRTPIFRGHQTAPSFVGSQVEQHSDFEMNGSLECRESLLSPPIQHVQVSPSKTSYFQGLPFFLDQRENRNRSGSPWIHTRSNNMQESNAGIARFQKSEKPMIEDAMDAVQHQEFSFRHRNGTVEKSAEINQYDKQLEYNSHGIELNKTKSFPRVCHEKPCTLPHAIRFFNEGIEVDSENRPVPRPNSHDLSASFYSLRSHDRSQNDSDDELGLEGKISIWGESKR
jgi:hypothetical protein